MSVATITKQGTGVYANSHRATPDANVGRVLPSDDTITGFLVLWNAARGTVNQPLPVLTQGVFLVNMSLTDTAYWALNSGTPVSQAVMVPLLPGASIRLPYSPATLANLYLSHTLAAINKLYCVVEG